MTQWPWVDPLGEYSLRFHTIYKYIENKNETRRLTRDSSVGRAVDCRSIGRRSNPAREKIDTES